MNTKYPTNGRYATLGDIVHEYRNYATVETIDSSGNTLTESLLDYIQDKPYELVWFDNVYSNTEKSEDGKSMKIIQHNSSSNYDRYILANELQTNSDNSFLFYIATANEYKGSKYNDINNIATSYYFNYKTSNGESTLLYIFNEIKNLVNNNDELKNLFGETIVKFNDYTSFDFIKLLNNYTISNNTSTYENIQDNAKKESKKYTSAGNNVKLYFYIKLYNNICRFVPGKLSALTLSKVTKITYKQNEPVYRCDIGINDLIVTFNVTEVLHDSTTTLPAGPLSGNTKMTFIVSYDIKYEHSSSKSSGKYSFSLTFDSINALTQDKTTWKSVRFILPNDNTEYKYGSSEFPYIESLKDNEDNLTYGSLTNFLWPADTSLCVNTLDNYSNNSKINIENSNNSKYLTKKYEGTATNYSQNIHKYFGSLRIHTAYKTTSEKDIQDTSFTCTVPIYRHKNYFIDETKDGNIESADIYIQLDPIYKNEKNLPNIREKITLHDSNYNLSNLTADYIVPYEDQDNIFSFISIYLKRGTYRTFLSGTVDTIKVDEEQYVNDKDCNIQSYTDNQWIQTNDITLTPVGETSDTEKLYKLQGNKNSNNIKYFRIGLKNNNENEYNSYIYLKKSSNITSSHKLKVKLFKTIDNYNNSLNLLVYNSSNDEKDYYTYNTIGFDYTGDINIQSFSNLYIQVSCIKSTTLFNNKWIYKTSDGINTIYYAYKDKSGNYQILENDLFKPLSGPININSTADSKGNHLYMSLSPIFIIYDETNNTNIQITYTLNNNTTINNKGYEYISNGSDSLSITHIKVIYNGDISTKDVNASITLNDVTMENIQFTNTTYDEITEIVLSPINKVSCAITEVDKQKQIKITWDENKGTITSSGKNINNGSNIFTLTELESGINITITAKDGYYLDKEPVNHNSNGTKSISDTINSDSTDKTYEFKEGYNVTCTCENGECEFSDYKGKKYESIYTNSDNRSKITITPKDGYEINKSDITITPSDSITVNSIQSGENITIEITKITLNGSITVKCKKKSTTDTTTP